MSSFLEAFLLDSLMAISCNETFFVLSRYKAKSPSGVIKLKKAFILCAFLFSAALMAQTDTGGPESKYHRNNAPAAVPRHIQDVTRGGGLAPTTWGFVSKYSGTLYGSGYYPFRVDLTYAGNNSIYGYTFNYPSNGFVNEIRAIYAFDISALAGVPGPVWSSFMFDTRQRPAAGSSGLSVFGGMNLESDGTTHTLTGLSLFQGNGATQLDIFNAEDFENIAPFDNPELAFTGNNPLLGTVAVTTNTVVPINFNVTSAVFNDFPVQVPTLGTMGLIALVLATAGVGFFVIRKKRV